MKKTNKGFSLIELIIAIAILIILTGLLAPQFMKYIERTRQAKMIHTLDSLSEGLNVAYVEALEKGDDMKAVDNVSIKFGKPISGSHSTLEYILSETLYSVIEREELESTWINTYFDSISRPDKDEAQTYYFAGVSIKYYPDTKNLTHFYYYNAGEFVSEETGTYGEYKNGKYIPWK